MRIGIAKIVRLRKRRLLTAALLGSVALVAPTIASAEIPSILAYNEPGIYSYHYWMPSTATVIPEGAVKFVNPYPTTPHGLEFTSVPAGSTTPSCPGLPKKATEPIGESKWETECTFSTPGTYTFICTVHPLEMKGTITVTNGEPTVTTEPAALVKEHEATLNGSVNPNKSVTEYFFKWGATEAYGEETGVKSAGAGVTSVAASAMLSGLAPAKTYHFRLVATNGKGTAEGADQTFTTASPPGPPSATTGVAGAVGETNATLKGTVNPDGRPTEYFFEWGLTETYDQVTAPATTGEDHLGHNVSAALSSLSPGTLYHFRLVARNTSSEIVSGADQTFTTLSPIEPPPTKTTTTTTPTPPPFTPPIGSLLVKPEPTLSGSPLPASSVKLSAPRRSSTVRGSLEVGQAGAGGRLEVDLLAKGSQLSDSRGSRSKSVRVGRLVRSAVSAGRLPFSVVLTAPGKRALARRHRLAVTVKIALTPTQGATVTVTRSVTLRS